MLIEKSECELYYAVDESLPNLFAVGLTEDEARQKGEVIKRLLNEGFTSRPGLVEGYTLLQSTSTGIPVFVPDDTQVSRYTAEQFAEISQRITMVALAVSEIHGSA